MTLVKMKDILQTAKDEGYGVGAFSVQNMEMIIAAIRTAEELKSPLILQIAEVRLGPSPLHLMGPMMVEAAKKASVPVAVHLDHGETIEVIQQALDYGFTSVMFDGSLLPMEENIARTKEVVALAKKYDATIEAEIGRVGGSEDGSVDIEIALTSVEEASKFAQETGVDALAVAIGNVHGIYKGNPELRLDRLEAINNEIDIPLVLHGGSGISEKEFRKAIQLGIHKINVATSTFNNVVKKVNENVPFTNYFELHEQSIQAACESISRHMKMFQSINRI